jgi:hypothetical protein
VLLLDTSLYPVKERAEVLRARHEELTGASLVPAEGDDLIHVRLRAWDMGDGCRLINANGTGIHFRRLPSQISSSVEPFTIGFCILPSGRGRFCQQDRHEVVPGGGMFIAEMSEAFSCQFGESKDGINLQIPLEVLDVPLHDVRNAAERLTRSPVYDLARQHLFALNRYTEAYDIPHPAAQQSTLHVLRALVRSFGVD